MLYSRFCSQRLAPPLCRHLSRPGQAGCTWSARRYLTHPYRCGEIQHPPPRESMPNPLTLLPVARSPSRRHCWHRWWALTPPFHPSPRRRGGSALCCGCSHAAAAGGAPSLAVS
jgi:hypothetical protein